MYNISLAPNVCVFYYYYFPYVRREYLCVWEREEKTTRSSTYVPSYDVWYRRRKGVVCESSSSDADKQSSSPSYVCIKIALTGAVRPSVCPFGSTRDEARLDRYYFGDDSQPSDCQWDSRFPYFFLIQKFTKRRERTPLPPLGLPPWSGRPGSQQELESMCFL